MSSDLIETYGHSLVQHGPANDRVYLMKLSRRDLPHIVDHLDTLAGQHGYSKIFAKVPASAREHFEQNGYRLEAVIPNMYRGRDDGLFMARYYDRQRMIDPAEELVREVLQTAQKQARRGRPKKLSREVDCRLASPADCRQMSRLYRLVFASYPFPIQDPDYLRETMADNVIYAGVWEQQRLVALASAEVDRKMANAELTDFATDPGCRGRGMATLLLGRLEALMADTDIRTCYTIARATSYGMNITFARHNYDFAGTLIKNTQIAGSLESMNIWHKQLNASSEERHKEIIRVSRAAALRQNAGATGNA